MKHFVTAFVLCSTLFAVTAFAQQRATHQAVRVATPHAPLFAEPSIFLQPAASQSEFMKGGSQLTPQTKSEALQYFQDTTNNFFTIFGSSDSFNIPMSAGSSDSITFYNWGYAERFSTSLTNAYLDSIQVLLGIVSVPPTNNITCLIDHNREDTNRTTGAILPGPDQHNTAIASKAIPGSQIPQGVFTTLTFKIPPSSGKKLATADHNFWAYIDKGGADPYQDSVAYAFDENITDQRDIDSTIDRTNVVTLDAKKQYFIEFPLAGNYTLVADPTQHFYPNMIAIAYLHDPTAGVSENTAQPSGYRLAQNYPNPVSLTSPSTAINYALPSQSAVTLKVTNVLGQEVQTLVNSTQRAGEHSVSFNATGLPTGMYFYTLTANGFSQTRSMIVAK